MPVCGKCDKFISPQVYSSHVMFCGTDASVRMDAAAAALEPKTSHDDLRARLLKLCDIVHTACECGFPHTDDRLRWIEQAGFILSAEERN